MRPHRRGVGEPRLRVTKNREGMGKTKKKGANGGTNRHQKGLQLVRLHVALACAQHSHWVVPIVVVLGAQPAGKVLVKGKVRGGVRGDRVMGAVAHDGCVKGEDASMKKRKGKRRSM